ncbi:hypothetical protein [Streptomyces sp. Wb2n-11]|uniref:hypothetical protein n=1 Tax=Streptomyces sp. Wb2n-11 TaxID=1030533 RepID=UPI000ADBABB7|nr:hypothetical protein [Streptomyces sp. Wb2n-11]
MHTAANAVPPLDDELEGLLEDLDGIHPGIQQIIDGFRLLAIARLTPDQTQTTLAVLAGANGIDVLTLMATTIQRLTNPATNPALRHLPTDQQKLAQHHGEQAAYLLNDPELHQPAAEACAAISGI